MALSKIDAANFLTGTIPSTNVANASLNSVTTLPAGVGGKVLQVVSATSTSAANTSSTSVVSFMNASITPSSSSNKIFCVFNGLGYANGTNNDLTALIYRGTTSGTEICSTKV